MQPLPHSPALSAIDNKARPLSWAVATPSQESLVDAEDNVTVMRMAPGQETGTCTRTPRVSSSVQGVRRQRERSGSSTANETGESEVDRLIEEK